MASKEWKKETMNKMNSKLMCVSMRLCTLKRLNNKKKEHEMKVQKVDLIQFPDGRISIDCETKGNMKTYVMFTSVTLCTKKGLNKW